MKKTFSLFIIFMLSAISYSALAVEDSTEVTTEVSTETSNSGSPINTGTILFIAGIIIFLVVVRKLYDKRNEASRKREEAKNPVVKENFLNPRFWFQCQKCKVTIRKDSFPKTADCFMAPDHHWTQMAEVGKVKYLCKSCNTLIEAKNVPVEENCPDAPVHVWERLP